jgi:hypothetical protein
MKLNSLLVKFSHYKYKQYFIYQSFIPRNTIRLVIRSLTFILMIISIPVHGQSKSSIIDSLNIVVPRLENIEIKVDGYLDESVWNSAASRSGTCSFFTCRVNRSSSTSWPPSSVSEAHGVFMWENLLRREVEAPTSLQAHNWQSRKTLASKRTDI